MAVLATVAQMTIPRPYVNLVTDVTVALERRRRRVRQLDVIVYYGESLCSDSKRSYKRESGYWADGGMHGLRYEHGCAVCQC
jgi:hypothetical protein